VEYEYSAAVCGHFFAEYEYSAAVCGHFFAEYEYSVAEYRNFFVEEKYSGEKFRAWKAGEPASGPFTGAAASEEGGLMALWSSGATWSSGNLWGPSSPTVPTFENNKKKKPKKMKRQPYYPKNQGEQAEWHTNFATKLPGYAATLSLTQAEEDNAVADNLTMAYALGGWLLGEREHSTACTSSLETLSYGTGSANFTFPVAQIPPLPTLPVGITGVKPGALQRTFDLAVILKRKSGYTEAMGLDMGIVGPEAPPPPPPGDAPVPRIFVTAIPGDTNEVGRVKFFKDGHEYVVMEGRRGGGAWEPLGMHMKSPFLDTRPLLVAGQAEVREYRGRFFDKGANSSGWSDVAKVTVGP
jgi:hypothetical protein